MGISGIGARPTISHRAPHPQKEAISCVFPAIPCPNSAINSKSLLLLLRESVSSGEYYSLGKSGSLSSGSHSSNERLRIRSSINTCVLHHLKDRAIRRRKIHRQPVKVLSGGQFANGGRSFTISKREYLRKDS